MKTMKRMKGLLAIIFICVSIACAIEIGIYREAKKIEAADRQQAWFEEYYENKWKEIRSSVKETGLEMDDELTVLYYQRKYYNRDNNMYVIERPFWTRHRMGCGLIDHCEHYVFKFVMYDDDIIMNEVYRTES